MSLYFNNLPILNFTLERILPLLNNHTQQTAYTLKTTPKNTQIYAHYQNHDKIYLLQSGRVKIGVKNTKGIELTHQIAWSGDVFGENTLFQFQNQASNQFAQTLEESTYYEIDAKALSNFLKEYRWVQGYFLNLFAKNLQKAEQRLYDFVGKDAPVRIIDFLMETAQEKGEKKEEGYELSPFFTQPQIASILGCSIPSISITLRDLKKKSLINCSKKQLIINDLDKLVFYQKNYCKINLTTRKKLSIHAPHSRQLKSA